MVRYGERELTHSGFTHDISRGGAFIVSPYRPALDSSLHLQLLLDQERSLYFEVSVRRHKIIPPQLRSVDKGGFGVRFLSAAELLADVLAESGNRWEVAYATRADLKLAYEAEFRHGGVFVSTQREVERGSDVMLCVRLDFVGKTFEFDALVVHVADGSTPGPRGFWLLFKLAKDVEAAMAPFIQ